MPSFTVKVPNGDEGEDLGTFESDYLPRVGDDFLLYHPRVTGGSQYPLEAQVSSVVFEAYSKDHPFAPEKKDTVDATVWLSEVGGAVKLYCDCTPEQREKWIVDAQGVCESCGHERAELPK